MAGPALAIEALLLMLFFAIIITLLIVTIRKRRSLRVSIPTGLLFLCLVSFSGHIYLRKLEYKRKASEVFVHDYTLLNLDGQKCDDCIVRLNKGYTYDIIINGKIIGNGDWDIETAIDIPSYFLRIENGPTYCIWDTDSIIQGISRIKD